MGVVHTLKENLVIIRTVLNQDSQSKGLDELQRFNELVGYAQPNTPWTVERLITLNNYNRSFLGIQSAPELGELTNYVLGQEEAKEVYKNFKKKGIQVFNGEFLSGKT